LVRAPSSHGGGRWFESSSVHSAHLDPQSEPRLFGTSLRLRTPTLFDWGDRDKFSPPSIGEQACAVLPDARIVVVDGAGQLCWIDRTDDCVRAIVEFLA
jgi:pimeloyl-ACP methyl ester carboxylesterase